MGTSIVGFFVSCFMWIFIIVAILLMIIAPVVAIKLVHQDGKARKRREMQKAQDADILINFRCGSEDDWTNT